MNDDFEVWFNKNKDCNALLRYNKEAALLGWQESRKWHPIKEAPKDRRILIYCKIWLEQPDIAFWDAKKELFVVPSVGRLIRETDDAYYQELPPAPGA